MFGIFIYPEAEAETESATKEHCTTDAFTRCNNQSKETLNLAKNINCKAPIST